MAVTDAVRPDDVTVVPSDPARARSRLGRPWVILAWAAILLLILGWKFVADPSLSAPTRDPAWYTWRANVILESDPGSVASDEWGPVPPGKESGGLFSGGYRVTTPLAGALLTRVAGTDIYTFSAFLMIGIPVLTGLAFGAGAYRSRGDPLVLLLTMLAAAALFLTTPYLGYLDNTMVLFLLALTFPFLHAARTSWGARVALFLIGIAAAFTHPTTCVLFGLSMMGVFGFHVLTSRFRFGKALQADGPFLMSVGFGMIFGLALWVVPLWGTVGSLSDAALPPPYTKAFFLARLGEWVGSLEPLVTVPFVVIAVASTILMARRERRPAHTFDVSAAWWMLPFAGVFSFVLGSSYEVAGVQGSPVVPYYRFMNASAAPIALVGLGAAVSIRWFLKRRGWAGLPSGLWKGVGAVASVAVVASLGWILVDGVQHRWVSEENQWANQGLRTSLAAVHEVVADAGERPNVLLMNYGDTDDPADRTNTAYGWAKTDTNVFRTGLPGDAARRSVTYMGTLDNLLEGRVTDGASHGYDTAAQAHFNEVEKRFEEYPEDPVVFVIGQYYKGLCNGESECSPEIEQQKLEAVEAQGVEVGPDVWVIEGDGLWSPPADVVDRAQAAANEVGLRLENHPGAAANPLHTLWVLIALALLVIVPGWLASPFFELNDGVSKTALIPGMSIVLTLLAGIAVLAVWRGPLTTAKGWTTVGLAIGAGAALRFAREPILKPLRATGGFFNGMFAVFSNADFAVLMGVQFLVQAGQGAIQGAIAKSIAFGGEKGFDVSNVPSADYLLKVVLALYVPYTLISPFIGVFIDRFARRRVVWWSNILTSIVTGIVALAVLLPIGSDTTEGNVGATAALVVALLAAQAVVRIALAVKSAAIPDVLSGKDLLQGNGLSQAGGALFQIVGIAVGTVAAGVAGAWIGVLVGAAVLIVAAFVAMRMRRVEAREHDTSFAHEASRVVRNIVAGIREVASRPPAALGLSGFQMLRYQFWGFGLFVFALYAKNLVEGGDANTLSLILSGVGGLLGGALGMILAQKWKDRVPPIRLLLGAMFLLGAGTLVFGGMVSTFGFALMLFVGFFAFFLGKISADTITQQAMPDDFRGRAFALFDIAYNLGFIVPALILSAIWIEGDTSRTRVILIVSGAVFLMLTVLVAMWARRIKDQFAPQDDLVEVPEASALPPPPGQ